MKDKVKFFGVMAGFFIASVLVALVNTIQAQTAVKVTYSIPGVYYSLSVPDGVSIKIEAWGGGAGGGVGAGSVVRGGYGGGGGGGGYVYKNIVTSGTTLDITVAAGGYGGSYSLGTNQSGFRGGYSTVFWTTTSSCTAHGGFGGEGVTMSDGIGGSGGGYSGGDGGDNGEDGTGRGGSCSGAGGRGANNGGIGGASQCGNASGNAGSFGGGGGSGGRMATGLTAGGSSGGDGARGEVWITMSFPTPAITSSTTQICSGSNVLLSVSNPASGVIYRWYRDGMSVGSGNTYVASQVGAYTIKAEYAISYSNGSPIFFPALGAGNIVTTPASNTITLTAATAVQLNPITLNGCSGSNFSITPANGVHGTMPTGTTYTWTEVSNTGVGNTTNNGIGNTTISLGMLTNISNTQRTVTYDVTPSGGGCTGNVFQVAVNVNPFPQISNIVKTVCNGEIVNITPVDGADGVIPSGTTYSWTIVSNNGVTGAANNSAANSTVISLGTLGNATTTQKTVTYSVTPVSGACTGNSFLLTVNVSSTINVSLIGNSNTYCVGGDVAFTALAVPAGNYDYDWYLDGGLVSPNDVNTFISTGLSPRFIDYKYHVVARSAGCEGISNSFAITVKDLPTVNITSNYTDICPNGSITATADVIPAGAYYYKWYLDSVESGYQQQFTLNNLPVGQDTIYVEITPVAAYNGCEVSSLPLIITVHPNPVVSISADNSPICAGDEAVIRLNNVILNNAVRNANNYSWQWSLNGVSINNAIQDIYKQTLTNAGTYNFALKMVQNDALGCASDWSNPVAVTVEELPQILLVSDNDTYCAGGKATLIASVVPANTYGYNWYIDNTLIANNGGDTLVSQEVARVTPYNYYVIARSQTGCEGTSNNVNITVKDLPTVNITSNYTDICPGGSITATANVTPTDNYDYKWYINNVESGYQQQFTMNNLPVGQDTVYVEVIPVAPYDACEVSSNPLIITIHSNPVITFTANNTAICDRGMVSFTTNTVLDSEVRNASKFVYQWTLDGSVINDAIQGSYSQMLEAGVYEFSVRVMQNDDLGCASNWAVPVTVTVFHTEIPPFITTECGEENVITQKYRVVNIPIDIKTGNPQVYTTFVDNTYSSYIHSGIIQNAYPLGTYVEAHLPLMAGDYVLEIDIEGCKYTTIARVLFDENATNIAKIIEQRWNDVLTVNNNPKTNGGFFFYSYQWYKNDVLIPNATKQTYTEKDGKLNGKYHVALLGYAILASNDTVEVSYVSCPFVPTPEFSVAIYPVPIGKNQQLKFSTSLSDEELTDAVLEIYDVMGVVRRQITVVSPEMSIEGFEQGAYFGRLKTQNNGTHNFKFVVLQ